MKNFSTTTGMLSIMLMLFMTVSIAQEKRSLGEEIYKVYETNGVDAAINRYQELKQDIGTYDLTEWELNAVAYRLMYETKDMDAADKVLRLNMEEYPEASNPLDSYGEYLAEIGKEEEAKEYYIRSAAISKNSNDDWEKYSLYPMTMSRIAIIDKKHKQLDFLLGEWQLDATIYENGNEMQKVKGTDRITFDEKTNSIILRHFDEQNEELGVRMMTYDALDDAYDVAYFNPERLMGIQVSKMKINSQIEDNYEFIDTYVTRDGHERKTKHEIKKISGNELEWVIFEQKDKNEWQRQYAMNMTR